MALLRRFLTPLQGQEVLAVMLDGRSFKGRLEDFDEEWLFMSEVLEGTTVNVRGWEEPTVMPGLVEKEVTFQGIVRREAATNVVYRMHNVLLNLRSVSRIWEWTPRNLSRAEHIRDSRTGTASTAASTARQHAGDPATSDVGPATRSPRVKPSG